jgi:hypothetical protein
MEYIYTFVGGTPDFVWLSQGEFRRRFAVQNAVGYLEQVRGTLASEARDKRSSGCFYTGLRHAFAEIEGLGKLYRGEFSSRNTAVNAIRFGRDYLGRVNSDYKNAFGLLFDMYRHGLAHTHLARTVRYRKGRTWHFIGWAITEERTDHLAFNRGIRSRYLRLVVSIPQLVDDTIAAIDLFIEDLQGRGPASRLFQRFRKGYAGTCLCLRERAAVIGRDKPSLNHYSQQTIDWVKAGMQRP